MTTNPIKDLPQRVRAELSGYAPRVQTIGKSHAGVIRFDKAGAGTVFVKTEHDAPYAQVPDEVAVLAWMEKAGLPAPRVLDHFIENGRHWLVMSAVPGTDMASLGAVSQAEIIEQFALALRHLHALPTADCPFDRRLDAMMARAREHIDAGLVDISDFDESRLGCSAESVYAELIALRPAEDAPVVCHGDASLPNFMMNEGRFSGYVDCGRLGVSDRYRDLAIAENTLIRNFGPSSMAPFFRAYGETPDRERMAFYQMLDEFF